MFSFVDNYLNKKAMMRAIKEIDLEQEASRPDISKVIKEREYQTVTDVDSFSVLKKRTAINKPLTTAVDLKDFKDWRDVKKVDSKNPIYEPKKRFTFDIDEDDDGEQPTIDFPGLKPKKVSETKPVVNEKVFGSSGEDEKIEKDTNINTYFKEKFGIINRLNGDTKNEFVNNKVEENITDIKQENKEEVKKEEVLKTERKKTSLNEMLAKKLKENPDLLNKLKANESKTEEKPQILDSESNKIKIEVVDFTEKKQEPPKPVKKTVNRKPRGKNKRRFDADVISNIDWK